MTLGGADRAGGSTRIRAGGRWRSLRPLDGRLPEVTLDGRPVVSFASNDYLGLAAHPAVVAAAHAALDRWGLGAGASRLVVGPPRLPRGARGRAGRAGRAPRRRCRCPTGFAANLGVLATLADAPDVLIVSDELNHASIIDGCRLARGTVAVARHADLDHVDALLAAHAGPAVVVTDTVFSMDGDVAPSTTCWPSARATARCLVLDEAHAVLGPTSTSPTPRALGVEVVRVGTLSKTLGSLGGFVAASRDVVDLLVNVARPFIFTTGTTPADAAGALAALRIVRGAGGRRAAGPPARATSTRSPPGHPSPIVPVVLGDERAALRGRRPLLAQGLLVPAIRPPTVAPGTSRLRVALSAAHTDDQVERLVKALADLPAPPAR